MAAAQQMLIPSRVTQISNRAYSQLPSVPSSSPTHDLILAPSVLPSCPAQKLESFFPPALFPLGSQVPSALPLAQIGPSQHQR